MFSSLSLRRENNFKGFTLVELLVVIGIIAVLATILLLQLGTARAKSRDVKRIADLNQIRSAVEEYFDDNGSYPPTAVFTGSSNALIPRYLQRVPVDPLAPVQCLSYIGWSPAAPCYNYVFAPGSNPTRYHLWAELEQLNRNAFNSDADINSLTNPAFSGHSGGAAVDGTVETCLSTSDIDCLFDLGQSQ